MVDYSKIGNNQTERVDIVVPEIYFLDPPPSNFLHAEDEGLYFRYEIRDPVTGGYMYDENTGLYSTNYLAYSIEYEGDYYWTYNVYREVLDSEDYSDKWVDKWLPANSIEQFPQTYFHAWDVGIEEIERNPSTGDLKVWLSEESLYTPFVLTSFDYETGDYEVELDPPKLDMREDIQIKLNDKIIMNGESEYFERDLNNLFWDPGETAASSDDIFTMEHANKHTQLFNLENEYINGEDTIITVSYYPKSDNKPSPDSDYKYEIRTDESSDLLIPTGKSREYDITFSDDLDSKKIYIPTHWVGGEVTEMSEFKFDKLFANKYIYPDVITRDLISMEYGDGITNVFPMNGMSLYATLYMDGYDKVDLKIDKRLEGGIGVVYIDEITYYDYQNEKVVFGTSNGTYEDCQGLVLPWDEVSNGKIELTVITNTYDDYKFNFELKIGSANKLRGPGGKYEIRRI